jgi:hypothetical protein
MADTIVNTPAPSNDSGAAGWMVAIIILLAVLAGGFYVYRYGIGRAPAPDTTNINVTVPNPLGGGGAPEGGAAQ